MGKHKTTHHIVPKSRGGRKTVKLERNFHQSYHDVFGNLILEEKLEFIKILDKRMHTQEPLVNGELEDLRNKAKKSI